MVLIEQQNIIKFLIIIKFKLKKFEPGMGLEPTYY